MKKDNYKINIYIAYLNNFTKTKNPFLIYFNLLTTINPIYVFI